MSIFSLLKLLLATLFLISVGYVYKPIIVNYQEKLYRATSSFSKPSKPSHLHKAIFSDDVQCEASRPNPLFLKFPEVRNSSCINTHCARATRVAWKIVIVVKSAIRNFALRELIRRTWGSVATVADAQFQTVFVVGRSDIHQQALINEEYKRYHDILQVDIPDVFRNVQHKALAAMYWAQAYLPDNYYYAEAEDDIMINPVMTQVHMHEFRQSTANRFWLDFPIICMTNKLAYSTPERQSGNKNFYSLEAFEWPFWPDYCQGGLFACSVPIARDLWKASRTGQMFEFSDVYITGILRQRIGMPRQMILEAKPSPASHIKGFSSLRPDEVIEGLTKEWEKIKLKFDDTEICTCEVALKDQTPSTLSPLRSLAQ